MPQYLPGGLPVHNFWQLNEFRHAQFGHDAGDCTPGTVGETLDIQSDGDFDVGIRPYGNPAPSKDAQNRKRADFLALARQRGGAAIEQGMDGKQALKAVRSFAAEFAAVNRQPPGGQLMWPGNWTTDILPALTNGKWVKAAGFYSVIDSYHNHEISGAWGATESHSILVGQYDPTIDTDVTWLDTTCDGRYSLAAGGRQVPKGPQRVPLSLFHDFTDSYVSANQVWGYTFTAKGLLVPVAGGPNTITAISAASPTHLTTAAAHGLVTGAWVAITGANATPALASPPYQVTVLDATHFSLADATGASVAVTVAGNTGTWAVTDAPDLETGEVPFDPCDAPGQLSLPAGDGRNLG